MLAVGEGKPTAELPAELLEMIVKFAVLDGDGFVLCALMHTACWIRLLVIEAFPPLRISESAAEESTSGPVSFSRSFVSYLWDVVEWLLADFATRRYKQMPRFVHWGCGVELPPYLLLRHVLCQIRFEPAGREGFRPSKTNTQEAD